MGNIPIPELRDIPRHHFLDRLMPVERMAYDLVRGIEVMGAHPLLTKAQAMVIDAKRMLADWVDEGSPGLNPNADPLAEMSARPNLMGEEMVKALEASQEALVFTRNWMRTECVNVSDYSLALSDVEGALAKVTAALNVGGS